MIYKRAFLLAFLVTIIGLGIYFYSTNQINSTLSLRRMPSFEWFQYQTLGMMISVFGILLFVLFVVTAVKNWIRW